MLKDKSVFRGALGPYYENAAAVADDTIDAYLKPYFSNANRVRGLERFVAAFDCVQTVAIERKLRLIEAPTLILWATDDVYFDKKWAHWLGERISGTRRVVEVENARLFFFEERAPYFNDEVRKHWLSA